MPKPPKPYVPFSRAVADEILFGLGMGFGLREICRGEAMPTRATVMRWLKSRPGFAAEVAAARAAGGLDGVGRPTSFGETVLESVYLRLCEGEPLRSICWDPAMPGRSTVHVWLKRHPEAARLVALGRDIGDLIKAERRWLALGGPEWSQLAPTPLG
ncbi:hypothetical protein LRS10_05810 [Phenylobacterium sp. J426]|uniref:terminase small subunit-like protein n=1 Tax=Phenylobacterium sp. J426 TaxID=2898439 RepID=UPI0021512EAA|nr:hypothetical protein [Phenylobacterium sp. J426]MCR5873734.1 hypothetical protein [Phenylobacterium sp. J426]